MTDPLDDLGPFTGFRSEAPDATPDALARAHRAVQAARNEASLGPRSTPLPHRSSRRPRLAKAAVGVLAVAVLVAVAAWPARTPGTLELLAQARAALAPGDQVVHYRVTVTASGDVPSRGVIERTEGWVRGRGDRRTEGRETTRNLRAGHEADTGWTETSWRPDATDPRRTVVATRSALGRAPTGPVERRVVGSARPTASVFAGSLDPRKDGSWTLDRDVGDTIVLRRSLGGSARLTVEIDRSTGLPRRFVSTDVLGRGGRSRFVTDVRTDRLPLDARSRRLLSIDAPLTSTQPTRRWGTPEASRLIDRARRLHSPPDGLVTVRSATTFVTTGPDVRSGRRVRTVRRHGTFLFEHGLLHLGRLTNVRAGKDVCPTTSWVPDPGDPDRVLFREGARRAVAIGRPTDNPVLLGTLGDRSDGWRVARRTNSRIVLRSPPRRYYSGGELVLDRSTGAVLRATTTPGLQDVQNARSTTTVQRITVTSRPARPGEPRVPLPRC